MRGARAGWDREGVESGPVGRARWLHEPGEGLVAAAPRRGVGLPLRGVIAPQWLGAVRCVEGPSHGGQALHAQLPRRSSLLTGVEPGCRVEIQITSSRTFSARS